MTEGRRRVKSFDVPVRSWPKPQPNEMVRCVACGLPVDGEVNRRGVLIGECGCGDGRSPWGS